MTYTTPSTMRFIGYLWAFPVTVAGLVFAWLAWLTGGEVRVRSGVVTVTGGAAGRLLRGSRWRHGGAAMTLGHVVIARDAKTLARSWTHERRHVRQFERWGPFLLPLSWATGLVLRWRGLDPYLDHPWEPPIDTTAGDR